MGGLASLWHPVCGVLNCDAFCVRSDSLMKVLQRKWVRLLLVGLALSILLAGISLVLSRHVILRASFGKTYSDIQELPPSKVGLVLGCARILSDGRENLFFKYRIRAAWEAFSQGKVQYLIVSGDNHHKSYDEPSEMKAALVARGVPADRIYCDYAGFRTLDSIVRAKEVFQEKRITVISQEFHNQRAIFIGQHHDLEVMGYNARDVSLHFAFKTRCREQLARVKAVLDVMILNRRPKFLGDPIEIGASPCHQEGDLEPLL